MGAYCPKANTQRRKPTARVAEGLSQPRRNSLYSRAQIPARTARLKTTNVRIEIPKTEKSRAFQ
jgi:hypothetical protein